jgi:hypothetical protein
MTHVRSLLINKWWFTAFVLHLKQMISYLLFLGLFNPLAMMQTVHRGIGPKLTGANPDHDVFCHRTFYRTIDGGK